MANFHYISEEQKKLIIIMSVHGMSCKDIEKAMGIGVRAIQRVKKLWWLSGKVVNKALDNGRPHILTSLSQYENFPSVLPLSCSCIHFNLQYLENLVEKRPDIMVWEMQNALFIAYNVKVDEITITQALHEHGFTQKKVWARMTTFLLDLIYRSSFYC